VIRRVISALVYLWSADRNDWELLGEAFGQAPKSGPDGRQWDVVRVTSDQWIRVVCNAVLHCALY